MLQHILALKEPTPSIYSDLKLGDVLLYRTASLFGWIIRTKTWSDVNHSETYIGNGLSAASRDHKGVGTYPLRLDGLKYVLTSKEAIPHFGDGLLWHRTCIGQGYDMWGVIRNFINLGGTSRVRQWCSEHTARFAKRSGYFPFGELDSTKVSPSMFLASPVYKIRRVIEDDLV